jgi:competence protein ComEC
MAAPARSGVLAGALGFRATALAPRLGVAFAAAITEESEQRRFFLWLPVAGIGGVALNLAADREPVLWLPAVLTAAFCGLAFFSRRNAFALGVWLALAATAAGFLSMGVRTARVATPMLDHVRIVKLRGYVLEADLRAVGARLVVEVADSGDMPASIAPRRIRVTTRTAPDVVAGDFVALQARLLPPSRAVLPDGYDFARDAYFEGVGAVGSALGPIVLSQAPGEASLYRELFAGIDRARNRLALRVNHIIGGDEGAIAAAMVTGKRDFLSNDAKDLIREAGIFHIITISGVQMTLVAGIFFFVARAGLALSPALALRYPIKKWAAAFAMAGSVAYDMATGSRVGTERALAMTLIVLGAVLIDRRALTMRNLALATFAILALEPEAVMGVSFQLSFAAVGALVAVMEARLARLDNGLDPYVVAPRETQRAETEWWRSILEKPLALLFATLCATSATASFMAYHFHDLSPYVLIGNPLTLTIIEFFAVPGALLGTLLYPLGLDAWVWLYVGFGIKCILWIARFIAEAPGSTLHVRAFAPWALPALSLAVLSTILWRSWLMRSTAIVFAALGLVGALSGPRYDVIVPPSGDQVAIRDADGKLTIVGKRFNAFAAEQWLAADADDRQPASARDSSPSCDRFGCEGDMPEGKSLSIVTDRAGFEEDCERADIVVSPLTAPPYCKPGALYDERRLAETGAVGLTLAEGRFVEAGDRGPLTDRPWSPAPKRPLTDRVVRPGEHAAPKGADPAEPSEEAPQ